ncbi:MAG: hypothetical protein AAB665_01485 [Patescibacteria group bacterium]
MKPILWRIWRFTRWPLAVLITLYVAIVIYSFPHALEKEKTEQTIARINAQRLTIENVNGEHLPPPPDPAQVDATIEGVDANANGIRDDVELAIFEKYPNNAKVRAAELQYAMALQMYLTEVFNSETWVDAVTQNSRGYACISQTYPRDDLKEYIRVTDARVDEVKTLMFNTKARQDADVHVRTFTTSFGLPNSNLCDISNQ